VRRAIALLLLAANAATHAAEPDAQVFPIVNAGKLGARVESISFPPSLPKELTSGLTNRILARVSVLDARAVVEQRSVEIAVRYDLWDETFSIESTMNGAVVESRRLARVEDVDALLRALPLPKLFDTGTLPRERELVLRVEVLLNPISREKMRTIRRWVAQNSAIEIGESEGIPISNAIFNRIFDQYSEASDLAAVWRVQASSAAFRLGSPANEAR
jgi:hypothetical protein